MDTLNMTGSELIPVIFFWTTEVFHVTLIEMNITHILNSAGVVGGLIAIGSIIFAESGLLIGFFLPGDTLLFPAGFFAATGKFPLLGVIIAAWIGAILGNESGYIIGQKTGPRLFRKKDGLVFRQDYVTKAEAFYEKYGAKTILIARFLPIIRTFAPLVAGVGSMDRKKFVIYNIIGAGLWVTSVVLLGYWLGSKIPNIDRYIIPGILVATVFTFGPTIIHLAREPRLRLWLKDQLKRVFNRLEK